LNSLALLSLHVNKGGLASFSRAHERLGWHFGGVSNNEIIDIVVVDYVRDVIPTLATFCVQKFLLSVGD
jgi:hypothetical protein